MAARTHRPVETLLVSDKVVAEPSVPNALRRTLPTYCGGTPSWDGPRKPSRITSTTTDADNSDRNSFLERGFVCDGVTTTAGSKAGRAVR